MLGGREADSPVGVLEAVAVVAPGPWCHAEALASQLEGDGEGFGLGEASMVLQLGQKLVREAGATRQVQGVDSRGELDEGGQMQRCDWVTIVGRRGGCHERRLLLDRVVGWVPVTGESLERIVGLEDVPMPSGAPRRPPPLHPAPDG